MTEDPYVYPGTYVLKNKPGIRNDEDLQRFEARVTLARMVELQERPVTGTFNRTHLHRTHKHIFQDIYAWAGQPRTVDIRKEDSTYFARPDFIGPSLDGLFGKLERKGGLVGLDAISFADRAGDLLGDLNAIHPFREGNGRTQQEFLRQLALRAGYELSWANVSRDDMYRESAISFATGNSAGLGRLIREAIISPDQDFERATFAYRALETMRAESSTSLKSAIKEERAVPGAIISGRVCLVGERHIAIETSPRSFAVLERARLTQGVSLDDRIKACLTEHVIAIEPQRCPEPPQRER